MGASACFHLASRGAAVLGLEQFDIPHARGSSHGYSRMIRLAYYEDPRYVPLLRRAYDLWDEIEQLSGQRLLHRTGGVYAGPVDGTLLAGAHKATDAHGLKNEWLSPDELRRRWPQFAIPEDWQALYEPEAGFLRPERVISTYAAWAMRRGAELHAHEPVRSWSAEARGVTVCTDRATYHADRLVFTGGAWSGRLLADLGVPLTVTRQALGWVWPTQDPASFELGRLPVWGFDSLDGGIYYGFPMIPDAPGLKLAHHLATGAGVDPDTVSREPEPSDEADFRPALARHLPGADGPLLAIRICLYTNAPDGRFIIDRHPQHPDRVQIACGFSGHGFKFASAVGELLADRAAGSSPFDPAAAFLRLPISAPQDPA